MKTDRRSDRDKRSTVVRASHREDLAPGLDPEILGDIDDLVEAIGQLDASDCDRLLAFWRGIDPDVRAIAIEDARTVAEANDRMTLIRSVQDEIVGWTQKRDTGDRPNVERWFAPMGTATIHQSSWLDALPAMADATTALALQDLLDDTAFDALFGPWLNAMGSADYLEDANASEDEDEGGADEGGGDDPNAPNAGTDEASALG